MKNIIVKLLLIIFVISLTGCMHKKNNIAINDLEAKAQEYCSDRSVVYVCTDYIQVVSRLPGVGSTYYRSNPNLITYQ